MGNTFTDPRLAAAVVDRMTFRAHIIETGKDSYRLRATCSRKKGGTRTEPCFPAGPAFLTQRGRSEPGQSQHAMGWGQFRPSQWCHFDLSFPGKAREKGGGRSTRLHELPRGGTLVAASGDFETTITEPG